MINKKLKKPFIIIISTILTVVLVIILAISPIVKLLVEKYDEKYTGRRIEMDWAYANPFTGYIHFSDVKIYESKSDSVFISADGLSVDFSLIKLLSKKYEISQITLDHPIGVIIQDKKKFSIDDLIELFSPPKTGKKKKPVHFSILNIKIINGEFCYREKVIPIYYFIKDVNIESAGKRWDADTIMTNFSFLAGIGSGNVKGNCTIDINKLDYRFGLVANKFDLQIIDQYLKNLVNYGRFSASVDADVKATGNFKDKEDINAQGMISINDFHFGKNIKEDYASFSKLVFAVEELSPKEHKYLFDSVSVNDPYFKYERYDHLNNIETMFGKKGANVKAVNADPGTFNLIIEIANYVEILAKNFFRSNYKIDRLAIYNGDLKFNDYSLSEKFSASISPLNIAADSINKNQKRVEATLKSGIKPYGYVALKLSINPNDSTDFDINYNLQGLPAAMFNPYIVSYTSFPLDRGTLEVNGVWNVRNGIIKSNNHLLVIDPRVSKRLRNKDRNWLPLPLIMFIVRDRGNVIDYEIPITGNLEDPKFHLSDVILHLLENIFVKPPTTPYTMEVRNVENKVEKSLTMKWEMRQYLLESAQQKFIAGIADFLKENPEASISIQSNVYEEKEKEYILFYEAKKKYFLQINDKNIASFGDGDSLAVEKMSAKDTLFVQYLDKQFNDSMLFTIQEKCRKFIGNNIVDKRYGQLMKQRGNQFKLHFKENKTIAQVKMYTGDKKIPYNGFSVYKISYKGELPNSLIRAYEQMNELDNEIPRKKYIKQRKKNSKIVK